MLVVDDHQIVCDGFASRLRGKGVDAIALTKAEPDRVRAEVERGRPDCALVDWKLPGWRRDGIRVIQEVKEASPDTPAVLMTNWRNEFEDSGRNPAEFEAFVPKLDLDSVVTRALEFALHRRTSLPWRALEALLATVEPEPRPLDDRLRNMIVQVCGDLSQTWEIEDLCAVAGRVSGKHLNELFTTELRTTPAHFVARWRVEAAKLYLRETDLGQDVIARRVGLGTSRNMNRVFKRIEGRAPGAFRTRVRSQ